MFLVNVFELKQLRYQNSRNHTFTCISSFPLYFCNSARLFKSNKVNINGISGNEIGTKLDLAKA